jgi:uncharacterized protein (TIGR02722 family)
MKKQLILAIGFASLTLASCGPKEVTRVSESSTIDLSGRWNDTDSRLVAEQMVNDGLSRPWLNDFVERNGKKPTIIVGLIRNRSSEHIATETFINDIERELINSGRVSIVQGGEMRDEIRRERADQQDYAASNTIKKFGLEKGADFFLQGSVNSIIDQNTREQVIYYQTDLELVNIETNEKVWIGSKKIKKLVK